MSAAADDIRFPELVRGACSAAPKLPSIMRGAWTLATLKRNTPMSIGRLLEDTAARHGDQLAVRCQDRRWTYKEFNAWANRCAHAFKQAGVSNGDRVAILMENRAEVLACVAGVVKIGGVATLLNHNLRGDALGHTLKLTDPKLLIIGGECREAYDSIEPLTAGLTKLWDGESAPAGTPTLMQATENAPAANPPDTLLVTAGQSCFYIFTSGTTGMPKASVMSHYRWLRGMAGIGRMAVRLAPGDTLYCALPLYHNNALTVSWGAVLGTGAAIAIGRKFSASRFWDEVRAMDATAFVYIGELCRYLLNRPESPGDRQHRIHTIVGNGLRPDLWEAFQNRFGIKNIAEFYGASEGNLVFVNALGQRRTAGYCPLSFAIVEFDAENERPVRGPDGLMRRVTKGGVGLLITEVSEKSPFDGYTDAKATESKLFSDVFSKGDRWFNTGDLVRDQGWRHIAFVDRVGDTFRWKGENVATTEVEGMVGQFPCVEHAVVYGVQIPGTDGRAGMAALSLKDTFDGAALASFLRERLPAYAVPLFLRLRAEQDTTSTFKYSKVELKRQGFDVHQINEPLYVLLDATQGYQPLTAEVHSRIIEGSIRL